MPKSHRSTNICSRSIDIRYTILEGMAKNNVYFVVLCVLYSWNVISGTSTTIAPGCHFLLS